MDAGLLLVTALSTAAGPAHPGPTDRWCGQKPTAPVVIDDDTCTFDSHTVRVSLISPTGCWDEDDMTLTFEQEGEKVEARWPGERPTSWWILDPGDSEPPPYSHPQITWKPAGACSRVDTLPAGRGKFLLLLRMSGRPNMDRLVAVLYDTRRKAVLDMKDVAAEGDLVARSESEVWFRERELGEVLDKELVKSKKDELPLPDGDRIVSARGDYLPLNPVWRVGSKNDRIVAERDLQRTFDRFSAYFATPSAFATAFAWERVDRRTEIRTGRTAAGRACVQPHRGEPIEMWRTLPWYCGPPASSR